MLLSITNTGPNAADLGYLLHKNPANVNTTSLAFGEATVFYPESPENECTAVLLIEVDPIALVRSKGARQAGWALGQYVNDRPFTASSFLSTAISRVYGTALNGTCQKRPELVAEELDLTARIPTLPAPAGLEQLKRIFAPLGYEITSQSAELDPNFPDWGESPYHDVTLRKKTTLQSLLQHLFVLIPVLDRQKHYWVGDEEIEKLLAKGRDWLQDHPERDWIVTRYLKFQRGLTREALARLAPEPEVEEEETAESEVEKKISLHSVRLDRVTDLVKSLTPASVLDLGCGEGKLLYRLLKKTSIPKITGMDVDSRSLEIAQERLVTRPRGKYDKRLTLIQGSLIYRDTRLSGHDVATLVEVIEHLDSPRLDALSRVVFECARPQHIIITTPNIEYNVLFEGMKPGQLRHRDHRFEWTRAEFQEWSQKVGETHGYQVTFEPLGEEDPTHGAPSQLAHFSQ
ncbi:3' terminal RNA ribose 2'-O-methyltransferase Hen1 [Verrucomicrobiaceae bacterium 227]